MPSLPFTLVFVGSFTTMTPIFKLKHSDPLTTLSLLQSCKSMPHFKQIHALLITTAQIKDPFSATKMLESYAVSAANINFALRLFHSFSSPHSYAWTTMIRAFVNLKDLENAIQYYRLMRRRGVGLNKFTFLFVLKAYSLKPSYKEGRIIHGKLVRSGFFCNVFIRNALIHLYSKCGDTTAARQLFDEMPNHSVVIWNTMLMGYFRHGDIDKGHKLFEEMPERNVESWNAIIDGYSKLGHVDIARSLFDLMPERDLVSWGSMISSYVQSRRAVEALELFKEMNFFAVTPDTIILTSVLSACAQVGALDMGRWIHAYISRNKVRIDVFLGTSLVDMYAKCGCIDIALQLFSSMPKKNLCSWNAMLSGLAIHGHGLAALELFKQMESAHVQPDDVTFIAVLSACNHIGSVDEGRKQFNRMEKEFNITPKVEHYGCMVDILGRGGFIDEAKKVIEKMPMEPNIVIWGALLNACKIHSYPDIGEDMTKFVEKLGSKDGGCYTLLSNMFAAKTEWDEVEKTRNMMREAGDEKKIPGRSSIELKNVVHEFFVEDRSHSNWKQVHGIVEKLSNHIEAECQQGVVGHY